MSDRLRSYPAPVDPSVVRPGSTSRLSTRGADGPLVGAIPIETILSRIHALPALSPAAVRALMLAERTAIPAREIVAVINEDARFGTRVMRAINAPCYNLPRPAANIND